MKYSLFSFILLCTIFTLIPTGCENTELQKSIPIDDVRITPRTTCNDCPMDYCCSQVQSLEGAIDLIFCGVYGTSLTSTPCSDDWGNCPISGYELPINLLSYLATDLFCAPINSAFRVRSGDDGSIRITCQYGQLTPYSIDLYFPGTNYVYVDGDCIVSGHCPL